MRFLVVIGTFVLVMVTINEFLSHSKFLPTLFDNFVNYPDHKYWNPDEKKEHD